MLRLTELKLPLDHPPQAIAEAAADRVGVQVGDLQSCNVVRRAHDARRKSAILMVYSPSSSTTKPAFWPDAPGTIA